jgi:hypothetical protein
MEIKLHDSSPLEELSRYVRATDVSPLHSHLQRPGTALNSKQMFAKALRRADISPVSSKPEKALSRTTVAYENVEKLIQEADSLKSQMQTRSEASRRNAKDARSGTGRLSSTREMREITNQDIVLKSVSVKPRSHDYKELYERAVAEHQADRLKWERERAELLQRVDQLSGHSQAPASNPQNYLLKINREIEDLKARVRRSEQQGEKSRSRA